MMSRKSATAWVEQELAKVTTQEKAMERVKEFEISLKGFMSSQAGIAAGKAEPHARAARFELDAAIKAKFSL